MGVTGYGEADLNTIVVYNIASHLLNDLSTVHNILNCKI